ncbi:MAG: TonB-dependent receptor [Acidobacteria bacterium]|nr:TonB-dependent receptor [Acidobacteriota bacterium]
MGGLSGTVVEEGTTTPIAARVCVTTLSRCADTDPGTGLFRLPDLRSGTYEIEVTASGRPPLRREGLEVRAGLEARVEVVVPRLQSQRDEVTVTGSVFIAPEEIKSSGFLVTRQEVYKAAGALQDVSRYIQTLPGVAIGSNDFRNDIIVRGGSPLENLYIIDNIEIPNINAFANFASAGGTVSLLDAELIQDVTFLTGGYPAPYINRTSSVLQVAQREGDRESFHGRATLGFAGGGTIFEGPIRKGKGSWVVSARRSFLDLVTDDVGFGGVPILYTYNAKALYDLTPRDRIWAVSVSGTDEIRLGAREVPRPTEDEEVNNLDIRYDGWRTANGLNWQRLLGNSAAGLLGITHSRAKVGSQVRDLVRNGIRRPGEKLVDLVTRSPLIYSDDSREGETTLKYDLTWQAARLGKLQAGGSYKIFDINYNTRSPLGTLSPYTTERDVNPFDLRRSFRAYQSSGYTQLTRDVTRRLNLTVGGRLDGYDYLGRSRFSPRAGMSYRLTERLSWRASYGQYFQQPFFLFLSAFPQNRGLIPFRADHYVTGLTYVATPTLRITLEAYAKRYKDYPVSSQFPQLSLANAGDTFAVRDILFPMVSAGRGRVRGVEIFAEKKFTNQWFGQANFAWLRSRQAGLDGVLRPSVYDYPRVANFVGGYRLNAKWEFSTRAAYLAGRPFTPFREDVSRQQSRGIFDLTRVNAERLPDYLRVDIRADRTFTVRDKPLLVFIGVQNAFNRRNVGGIGWNRATNVQQQGEQLGLFPLVGLDWRF